jgi:hypothetical protein
VDKAVRHTELTDIGVMARQPITQYVIVRDTSAGLKAWTAAHGPGNNRGDKGWSTAPDDAHQYSSESAARAALARQVKAGNEGMDGARVIPYDQYVDAVLPAPATAPDGDHGDDVSWSEVVEQAELEDYWAGKEWEQKEKATAGNGDGNGDGERKYMFPPDAKLYPPTPGQKYYQYPPKTAPAPRQTAPDPIVRQQVTQWMDAFLAYQKNADDADDSEDREYWLRRANVALTKVHAAQQVLGLMGLYVTWPIA